MLKSLLSNGYYLLFLLAWAMNSCYAVSALMIAGLALLVLSKIINNPARKTNITTELFKNNMSVAIVTAAVILAVALVVSSAHGYQLTNARAQNTKQKKYNRWFKKYSHRFFARAVNWHWFKAHGFAESSLNPLAVSSAGARGLMQIMPGTSKELAARLGVPDLPFDSKISIMMGISYDRQMWERWKIQTNKRQRLRFMFSSYNAGLGNIRKAWRLSVNKKSWDSTAQRLPQITGKHAIETILYVRRIEKLRRTL